MDDARKIYRNLELVHDKVLQKANLKKESDGKKKKNREFKQPELDTNISEFSRKRFAPQSRCKMMWAVNLCSDWRANRILKPGTDAHIVNANLEFLNTFSMMDLCYAMCRFVHEVKKLDGTDYPPNTVRELVIMIQMYLHEKGIFWKLLDQEQLMYLHNVVDNTMKEHHSAGLGVRKSSDIISLEHEDKLFASGILGESSAFQLLRTIIYMMGMHCALRGGAEYNNLRRPGCNSQFSIEYDKRGKEMLVHHEDPLQKNNQGGLSCKGRRKVVYIYAASNIEQCPIQLFKKYTRLMPSSRSCKKFYLRCRKVPNL